MLQEKAFSSENQGFIWRT